MVQTPTSVFEPVRTLTANIALEMAYAVGDHRSALFLTGLLLLGDGHRVNRDRGGDPPKVRPMAKSWGLKHDPLPTIGLWMVAGLICGVFLLLMSNLIWQGLPYVTWEFLTEPPSDAGRQGGIGPILVSTGLILLVCMAVALPIGLGTAMFLAEFTSGSSHLSRFIRRSLDVLAGVPSIVFGLFGNAFFFSNSWTRVFNPLRRTDFSMHGSANLHSNCGRRVSISPQ